MGNIAKFPFRGQSNHGSVLCILSRFVRVEILNLKKDSEKIDIYFGTSLGRISKLEFDSEVKSQNDLIENQIRLDYNEICITDNPSIKQMIVNGTDLIVSFENFIVTKGLQCENCR